MLQIMSLTYVDMLITSALHLCCRLMQTCNRCSCQTRYISKYSEHLYHYRVSNQRSQTKNHQWIHALVIKA